MLPFWASIAALSILQGSLVALPRALTAPGLARVGGRGWAVIPALSVIAFVAIAQQAERVSAQALTYLALCAVPLLAALALGWLSSWAQPRWALLVPALFALAWLDRGGLGGELAAVLLSALSCAALGSLLAAVTPRLWLAAGILAMALADTALVISDQLQRPNSTLNRAHPVAGLPRLQSAVFGSAVMGYGDLFIAGVLGGLLASSLGRSAQLRGALITSLCALAFDLLFLLVDELPATVPVAAALGVVALSRSRGSAWWRQAPAPRPHGAPPGERARAAR